MDELSIAQSKINQLTRRVEELEELVRTARSHSLEQQIIIDNLEQSNTNQNFCDRCEERLDERLCFNCYDELITQEEDEAAYDSDDDTRPNSPYSKIIQT